jgi:hypothetical protein
MSIKLTYLIIFDFEAFGSVPVLQCADTMDLLIIKVYQKYVIRWGRGRCHLRTYFCDGSFPRFGASDRTDTLQGCPRFECPNSSRGEKRSEYKVRTRRDYERLKVLCR